MKKEENIETQNTQKEPSKYSRRSFYLNRKKKFENKDDNIESNTEQKIKVNKKTPKKTNKKLYSHNSHPKLKLKSLSLDDNKTINGKNKLKKYNSFKLNINLETIQNKIFFSDNKKEKNNKEKLNKSNSVKNIPVKINKNIIINPNNNEVNNNKIKINLKQNNDTKNENKPEIKNYRINKTKSPNKNETKVKINNTNSTFTKKNETKTNKYTTTNVNVTSTKTNVTKNVVEVKTNKTQQKMDMLKAQGKSLLLGAPKKECTICHKYIETHLLKIHMNLHFSRIMSWLYLGNFENAQDVPELRRNNIGFVLNCAIECNNKTLPKSITELHLNVRDEPEFYIIKYFDQSNEFINKVRTSGGSILVHCKMGLSRSPSFIIAYLVKYYNFTVDSAINYLRRKRPYVNINHGFIEQLHQYEKTFKKKADKK